MQNKELEVIKRLKFSLPSLPFGTVIVNKEDLDIALQYIDQLETDKQKLIKKLEEVCEKVDDEMADFEAIDLKHKILEILKGEKE